MPSESLIEQINMKAGIVVLSLVLVLGASRAQECAEQLAKAQKELKASEKRIHLIYLYHNLMHDQDQSETLTKIRKELDSTKAAWKKDLAVISSLEAKIADLEKKLASPLSALLGQASATATVAKTKLTEIVLELQAGKWEAANKLLVDTLALAASSLSHAKAFIEHELEEHLPEAKKAISQALSKASTIYDTQVKGKVDVVGRQLVKVNEELKAFIKGKAEQYPPLRFLEDPVNLQLIVYAIFIAPCFLLLLPLILWMAISFTPDTTSSKSNSASNGKGFRPKPSKPHKKK